jgi:outer membrane lipoprotein-sorting protein
MRVAIATVVAALFVSGCASKSSDVTAAYVSPLQYETLNCRQLAEEARRVSARAAVAAGAQDSQATKDTVATTAAIVIFWPAAFFIGGDKQNAAELSRLKGEMEAIEQASVRKQCGIQFQRAS